MSKLHASTSPNCFIHYYIVVCASICMVSVWCNVLHIIFHAPDYSINTSSKATNVRFAHTQS